MAWTRRIKKYHIPEARAAPRIHPDMTCLGVAASAASAVERKKVKDRTLIRYNSEHTDSRPCVTCLLASSNCLKTRKKTGKRELRNDPQEILASRDTNLGSPVVAWEFFLLRTSRHTKIPSDVRRPSFSNFFSTPLGRTPEM
jgi:hypothetical protein